MMKAIKNSFLFITVVLFLLTSCNPMDEISEQIPEVSTGTFSNVTNSTATCEGSVVNGSDVIIARGVCMSTTPLPTVKNDTTLNGTGTGSFNSSIINLSAGITYYVRAYATTATGTWYGNVLQITTESDILLPYPALNPNLTYGTMTDIEGHVYQTITIGSQTWMAENLSVTKYRNGEAIPNEKDNSKWKELETGAYCNYNNNSESNSIRKFGRLYNFYATTDSRNIAPNGWHIASDAEWSILNDYIAGHLDISTSVAQAIASTTDWTESSTIGAIGCGCLDPITYSPLNNSSGFSALPSGIRGNYGEFNYVGNYCGWWCSNQLDKNSAWFRSLNFYGLTLGNNTYNKQYGLSIRCVKD